MLEQNNSVFTRTTVLFSTNSIPMAENNKKKKKKVKPKGDKEATTKIIESCCRAVVFGCVPLAAVRVNYSGNSAAHQCKSRGRRLLKVGKKLAELLGGV